MEFGRRAALDVGNPHVQVLLLAVLKVDALVTVLHVRNLKGNSLVKGNHSNNREIYNTRSYDMTKTDTHKQTHIRIKKTLMNLCLHEAFTTLKINMTN